MARKAPWTNDEDVVIISHIKAHPENIRLALETAAAETGRTFAACQARWYTHISKHTDKYHTCFVTISKGKYAKNRKTVKTAIPEHSNSSIWARILSFFFD